MHRITLPAQNFRSIPSNFFSRVVAPKRIYYMFALLIVLLSAGTLIYSMPAEIIGLIALIALTICHFVDTFYCQKSDRRLEAIFEASPNPIIVFNKLGQPRKLNPAFTRDFGWTLGELKLSCDPLLPEAHKQSITQKIVQIFNTGRPVMFETQCATRSGGLRDVIVSAATVRGRSELPFEAVVNITDITDRKLIEGRLQMAHKMEAMGTLASGIAHDFNNILSPLIGYSEMLSDDLAADSPLQEKVAEILMAGKRAKELVMQILAFSRHTLTEPKALRLQPIVSEVLKLLRSSIPATIEIRKDLDSDCGPVLADPGQVHRVVMNLATNAFQAMEATGGRLSVFLKQVCLDEVHTRYTDLQPGKYALLTVADTGTGIDRHHIARIFDPYFTTKSDNKGTGLGLSIVQGIVKSVGGDIQVFSESGHGTEFHVYWPLDGPGKNPAPIDPQGPIRGGTEKILLVDDEAPVTKMVRQVLERLGYRVAAFTSSADALAAFQSDPDSYDLVLTDMTMPGMTGDQLARKIMAIRPRIPIILSTGYSRTLTAEVVKAIGIRGILMKPATKSNLATAVREVLDEADCPLAR